MRPSYTKRHDVQAKSITKYGYPKDLIRSVAPRIKWTESDVVALLKKGTARLRVPDPIVAVDSPAPDVVENHRLNSLDPTDIAAWKHRGTEHEPVNDERPHLPSAVTI